MCIKHDILATLAYFDLFDYPLTQTEIFTFLSHPYKYKEFTEAIFNLTETNWIFRFDELYTLKNNYALIVRRRKGNSNAKKLIQTARKVARLLSCFPFVRGIAVSGSLSKNFADENSDIDLFIITAKNRLWLARTFMHVFKKITFLFQKQHLFCMNYYIDEERLQIKEKNIYTAVEVVTLLPLQGITTFEHFYQHNTWSKSLLPNHSLRISYVQGMKRSVFKKTIEILFDHALGNWMDTLLMRITASRWAKKTKKRKLNSRGIIMSMEADKHFAKPNPVSFQNRLLEVYATKVETLISRYEHKLKSMY